jgi:RNA 2',3'-cyclic 3'-phosphodiesterase
MTESIGDQNSIRVFLAVALPGEIKARLEKIQERLQPLIRGVRWTRPESIHLTLQFFGYIPPDDIGVISEIVKKNVEGVSSFMLNLGSLGAFPAVSRPRVIYVGLSGDTGILCRLHEKIATDLEGSGFKKEERAFTSHLTLGRLKSVTKFPGVADAFTKIMTLVEGSFTVKGLNLYRSDLHPAGAVYTVLEQFLFEQGAR